VRSVSVIESVVAICGEENSGKTKTVKTLIGVPLNQRRLRNNQKKVRLKGRDIYVDIVISLGEEQKKNTVQEIIAYLEKLIKRINNEFPSTVITLILIFSIRERKGKEVIAEPIKWLRQKFPNNVFIVYLRLEDASAFAENLMQEIPAHHKIDSVENYPKQANKLREFIEGS